LASTPLLSVVDTVFVTFGPYPLSVPPIRGLPADLRDPACLHRLPARRDLLGRTDDLYVPTWLAVASPAVGALLYAAAVKLFHQQMRSYASPGH